MIIWRFRSSYWTRLSQPGETKAVAMRKYVICLTDYTDTAEAVTWAVYGSSEFNVTGDSNM
jgi:hypothetical protein